MIQNYNNNKDESTLFTFACFNARLECDYITHNKYYLEQSHVLRCDFAPEREKTKTHDKSFKCSEEGCTSSFSTNRRLNKHVKRIHQA
jgi:hypothetical protein